MARIRKRSSGRKRARSRSRPSPRAAPTPGQSAFARWIKSHIAALVLLVGLGAAYFSTVDSHGMFMWDEAEYASIGERILQGKPYGSSFRPPVMPLTAAAALAVTGHRDDWILKCGICLFGLAAVLVVYAAVSKSANRSLGLASAALLGTSPSFWEHTSYFLSEIPFILFFSTTVLCFLIGLYCDERFFVPAWLGWGFASITRYTSVLFGPIAILFVLLALLTRGERFASVLKAKWFWLSPLAALGPLLPWLIRQWIVYGDVLVGYRYASRQLDIYLPGVSMPWHFYLTGMPGMFLWPVIILAIVGAGIAILRRDPYALSIFATTVFLYIWFTQFRYKELRLLTSVLPFVSILAAYGWVEGAGGRLKTLRGPACILGGTLFLGILAFRQKQESFAHSVALGYPSFTAAMEFVRENFESDAVLMTSVGPQQNWYSGGRPNRSIPGDPGKLREALGEADWLVITNFERGQPGYALSLVQEFTQADAERGSLRLFQGGQFTTVLLRADILLQRLPPDFGIKPPEA